MHFKHHYSTDTVILDFRKRHFIHFGAKCSCAVGLIDTPQRIHDCFGLLVLVTLWFAGGFAEKTLTKCWFKCDINVPVPTWHDTIKICTLACIDYMSSKKKRHLVTCSMIVHDGDCKNNSNSERARAAQQTPISKVCATVLDSWLGWHAMTLHMPYSGHFFRDKTCSYGYH